MYPYLTARSISPSFPLTPPTRDDELATKAKDAFVMELLREHHLSQGKAAELLAIDRHELFDLMTKYRVPVINLTPEELAEKLKEPFPHS